MNITQIHKSKRITLLTSALLFIGFLSIACDSSQTSQSTNVLQPTYTPQPTFTPRPTYTPQIPNNTNQEHGSPYSLPRNVGDMEDIWVNLVSQVGDVEVSSSIHDCKIDGITRFVSPGESASIQSSAPNCYNTSGQEQWYTIKLEDGTIHWVTSNHIQPYHKIPFKSAKLTSSTESVEVITIVRDCKPYGMNSYVNAGETVTILSSTPGCLNISGMIKWSKIMMRDGSLYWIENMNLRLVEGGDSN